MNDLLNQEIFESQIFNPLYECSDNLTGMRMNMHHVVIYGSLYSIRRFYEGADNHITEKT